MTGSDITKELETLRRRVAELECLLTEREQKETKNKENGRQYHLVTDNVTDVIWKVNLDSPDSS